MIRIRKLALVVILAGSVSSEAATAVASEPDSDAQYDVLVYGGTSGGVIAAVQAKRMGKRVMIVCPDKHLGGLSSGGMGFLLNWGGRLLR